MPRHLPVDVLPQSGAPSLGPIAKVAQKPRVKGRHSSLCFPAGLLKASACCCELWISKRGRGGWYSMQTFPASFKDRKSVV